MHQVESLTRLYRARYYRHTPDLNRTVAETLALFGDLDAFGSEFINQFLISLSRQPVPDCRSSRVFYEPCNVIKTTAMEIVVESVTMPPKILELYPDFNTSGRFNVSRPKLQRDGMALHTRHGDYFYLAIPEIKV